MFVPVLIFLGTILEMLPISSSTHLRALQFLWCHDFLCTNESLIECIDFLTHGPILIVIVLFFFKRWKLLLRKLLSNHHYAINYIYCGFLVELITLLFYVAINYVSVSCQFAPIGFLITSAVLLSESFLNRPVVTTWHWKHSLLLGIAQGLAFLPGVSRLGITFFAARWCGFSQANALELSFMIEVPISAAAFAKGIYDCHKIPELDLLNWQIAFSMVIAIGVAYCLLCLVSRIIQRGYWWIFGIYTLGCAVLLRSM